jgi:hypothetical protein
LRSSSPGGTLTCEELEWLPEEEVIKARGRVRYEGESFTLGPLREVWATPDFQHVATPEMFRTR